MPPVAIVDDGIGVMPTLNRRGGAVEARAQRVAVEPGVAHAALRSPLPSV
jgi:hypothetical protein